MENSLLRLGLLLAIVLVLFPILLGGFAGLERGYRRQWQQMREEHMRRVAAGRMRYEERRARARAWLEAQRREAAYRAGGRTAAGTAGSPRPADGKESGRWRP